MAYLRMASYIHHTDVKHPGMEEITSEKYENTLFSYILTNKMCAEDIVIDTMYSLLGPTRILSRPAYRTFESSSLGYTRRSTKP